MDPRGSSALEGDRNHEGDVGEFEEVFTFSDSGSQGEGLSRQVQACIPNQRRIHFLGVCSAPEAVPWSVARFGADVSVRRSADDHETRLPGLERH